MTRLAIVFSLFIAAVIVMADTSRLGFMHRLYDFPYGDKAGHFVLFGTLTLLVCLAVLRSRPGAARRVAIGTTLAITALVTVEEMSQAFMPSRRLDVLDLAASYAGIVEGSLMASAIARRRRTGEAILTKPALGALIPPSPPSTRLRTGLRGRRS